MNLLRSSPSNAGNAGFPTIRCITLGSETTELFICESVGSAPWLNLLKSLSTTASTILSSPIFDTCKRDKGGKYWRVKHRTADELNAGAAYLFANENAFVYNSRMTIGQFFQMKMRLFTTLQMPIYLFFAIDNDIVRFANDNVTFFANGMRHFLRMTTRHFLRMAMRHFLRMAMRYFLRMAMNDLRMAIRRFCEWQ